MQTVPLIVLGSIAIDDIETPFGSHTDLLGGSATYAAYSGSFYTNVGVVSIVGDDFHKSNWKIFKKKKIDISGIQVKGKTFSWKGFYEYDMNVAKTVCTSLNCLEGFKPVLPDHYKKAKYVFLGNSHPSQQLKVIEQMQNPEVIGIDTMNLWIEHARDELIEVIRKADILFINDGEARELFKTVNLAQAAKKAINLGLKYVIIKKGEHGAVMFTGKSYFSAPGYPLEVVKDPTGCGDCFGGGVMGYIAKMGGLNESTLRKAIVYGSTSASFNAEDFGLNRLRHIKKRDISARFKEFKQIRNF